MKDEGPIRTIRSALDWSRTIARGAPAAGALDAHRLLAHVLEIPVHEVHLSPDREVSPRQAECFREYWRRRLRGHPLQYLVGETEFFSLRFEVTPGVFIPRPETERLVESVISRSGGGGVWVDAGTGAGVIAVSLAVHLSGSLVYAVDRSTRAAALARRNASLHGVGDRVRVVCGDLLRPFRRTAWADGVVSNPPYVATREKHTLPVEVREHEPEEALYAGPDGLAVIRRLVREVPGVLKPGGLLAVEIGETQSTEVRSLLGRDRGWDGATVEMDLADRPRVAVARWSG